MSFKARKKVLPNSNGGLIPEGDHVVSIKEAKETYAKTPASGAWKDKTPQIQVVFEDLNGKVLSQWVNMKGYKSATDADEAGNPIYKDGIAPKGHEFRNSAENTNEQYLVNIKTGERVVSPEKSEIGDKIIGEMASDAGMDEDEDFELADLVGKEIGIHVRTRGNNLEVHYTMPAAKVEEAAE